jgi:hypothetical protein
MATLADAMAIRPARVGVATDARCRERRECTVKQKQVVGLAEGIASLLLLR